MLHAYLIIFNCIASCLQIQSCLSFAKMVDARIPSEFVDEFREIAPTFVDPYCRFMKNRQGPSIQASNI